ncbi:hypothetical protein KM043_015683 [Ampulex compressa]|nr:hypothetical protein KM043_015683 [Ampulex compressa]
MSPMSDDPTDLLPFTPGHLVIGDSLTSHPEHDISQIPIGDKDFPIRGECDDEVCVGGDYGFGRKSPNGSADSLFPDGFLQEHLVLACPSVPQWERNNFPDRRQSWRCPQRQQSDHTPMRWPRPVRCGMLTAVCAECVSDRMERARSFATVRTSGEREGGKNLRWNAVRKSSQFCQCLRWLQNRRRPFRISAIQSRVSDGRTCWLMCRSPSHSKNSSSACPSNRPPQRRIFSMVPSSTVSGFGVVMRLFDSILRCRLRRARSCSTVSLEPSPLSPTLTWSSPMVRRGLTDYADLRAIRLTG